MRILVFVMRHLFSHTLLDSLEMVDAAFPMRLSISLSSERFAQMVEPRYVNSSTISSMWSLILKDGTSLASWAITTVFLQTDSDPELNAGIVESVN